MRLSTLTLAATVREAAPPQGKGNSRTFLEKSRNDPPELGNRLVEATTLTQKGRTMKSMNHAAYQKSLRTKTVDSLRFIAKDAHAAMLAHPHGENAGYYADEVHYATMELRRRGL